MTSENNGLPWDKSKDTTPYRSNAFGKIRFFAGESVDPSTVMPGASARFLRLAGETDDKYLKGVYDLLIGKDLFNLPKPDLLIEITGAAKEFVHVDKRVIDRFNSNLIEAANSTNAWLVTGGTHAGIMKTVGEAVTKYRLANQSRSLTCLGITAWGVVNRREELVSENGIWPDQIGDKGHYEVEDHFVTKDYPSLDPGHNCFLLVDNTQEKRFYQAGPFRTSFLKYVAENARRGSPGCDTKIPLVLLVVGGGPGTLDVVHMSILGSDNTKGSTNHEDDGGEEEDDEGEEGKKERKHVKRSPAIIFPGFGGFADVLAFAFQITEGKEDKDERLFHQYSGGIQIERVVESVVPKDFDERIRKHPEFARLFQKRGYKTSSHKKELSEAEKRDEQIKEEKKEKKALEIIEKIKAILQHRNCVRKK